MASIHLQDGTFVVMYRFDGRQQRRSLGTDDEKEARGKLREINETLSLIKSGRITVPEPATNETVWTILRSGGRITKPVKLINRTLGEVVEAYFASMPKDVKSEETIRRERSECKQITRIIGERKLFASLRPEHFRQYVIARQQDKGKYGKNVQASTIRLGLHRISQVWDFANENGWVTGDNPTKSVKRPRSPQPEPFMTMADIDKRIKAEKASPDRQKEIWSGLFLDREQVAELLKYVKAHNDKKTFTAIALVAYTGCRRAEMRRAKTVDIDLTKGIFTVRETKRIRSKTETRRYVRLHPELVSLLRDWFKINDSEYVIPGRRGMLTKDELERFFSNAVANSKWRVVEGFHVLRHSWVSIADY